MSGSKKVLPTSKCEIQLRYSDLDPMGHVSNHIYGQYFELARTEWLKQITGDYPSSVVANINIDYLAEIRPGDKIHVITYCTKVGNKSIQLMQEAYANDRLVTRASVVLVGFDRKTRETVPLLPGWEPSVVE